MAPGKNHKNRGWDGKTNTIIKETSICRIHEGKLIKFPFFRLCGGVTLTKEYLILTPVRRTLKCHFVRLLVLICLCTILVYLLPTVSQLILLLLAIVVATPVHNKLSLLNLRKRVGNTEAMANRDDCLMIPVHSIKKVNMDSVAAWNYIRVSYDVGRGLCNDVSFVVLLSVGIALKKTQREYAEAIKEAMISARDEK